MRSLDRDRQQLLWELLLLLERKEASFGEYFFGHDDRVQRLGEPAIDSGVNDGLNSLGGGESNIECSTNVDAELWLASTESGQRTDCDELATMGSQ